MLSLRRSYKCCQLLFELHRIQLSQGNIHSNPVQEISNTLTIMLTATTQFQLTTIKGKRYLGVFYKMLIGIVYQSQNHKSCDNLPSLHV